LSISPRVTIVVPTYNRCERLQRVLGALERQTCGTDAFDVVVVSDGSTDGTDEYLRSLRTSLTVTLECQTNTGPAAARNRGIQLATAPLVLFIDDDVVATPELVAEHLASHERTPDLVVIGPMITPPGFHMQPWVAWEQAMLYKQYNALAAGVYEATHRQFYTGNASVPRGRLVEAGGFDTRFRRAEDVELAYRLHELGLRFEFNARAIGHHYAERPFASWLKTAHDYGVAEVVFGLEHRHDPALKRVRFEYTKRHALIRGASRAYVAAPLLAHVFDPLLRVTAHAADRVHLSGVSRLALSTMYNGAYYQGMAQRLGGRTAFRETIVRGRTVFGDAESVAA
jgi:glycosyltransferase involved in cell wall biosynthesis